MPKALPLVMDSSRKALIELQNADGQRVKFTACYLADMLDKCRTCIHDDAMCERRRKVLDVVVDTVFEGAAIIWVCAAYEPRRAQEEGEG